MLGEEDALANQLLVRITYHFSYVYTCSFEKLVSIRDAIFSCLCPFLTLGRDEHGLLTIDGVVDEHLVRVKEQKLLAIRSGGLSYAQWKLSRKQERGERMRFWRSHLSEDEARQNLILWRSQGRSLWAQRKREAAAVRKREAAAVRSGQRGAAAHRRCRFRVGRRALREADVEAYVNEHLAVQPGAKLLQRDIHDDFRKVTQIEELSFGKNEFFAVLEKAIAQKGPEWQQIKKLGSDGSGRKDANGQAHKGMLYPNLTFRTDVADEKEHRQQVG